MKWTYIVEQKMRAATVLAVVFGLMLITNRLDKSYFSELQNSFTSVYQDRLLAERYIYQLSELLHRRSRLMNETGRTDESLLMGRALDDSINRTVASYAGTQLTKPELRIFTNLQRQLALLPAVESCFQESFLQPRKAIEMQYHNVSVNLDSLSAIQITEAKSLIISSNRVIASSRTISQLEIGILLLIGLIIQALILASKSEFPRFSQDRHLN